MKLFYADCETTGLDEKKQESVQWGIIIEQDGMIVDEIEFKMKPDKPNAVQQQAIACHGISLKELLKWPKREQGFKQLMAFLQKNKVKDERFQWVGQNPDFDRKFMYALFEEFGSTDFKLYFERDSIDLILVAKLMAMKKYFQPKNFKLTTMAEELGIKYKAHDAMEDIRVTRKILQLFLSWINKPVGVGKQLQLL